VAGCERVEKGRETYLAEVGCIQRDLFVEKKTVGLLTCHVCISS
jgi:hypothetical protein